MTTIIGTYKRRLGALTTRTKKGNARIHHSDRGVQYCSFEYVKKLKSAGICISMTDSGEAYENQIAERVNGISKTEFKLNRVFKNHMEALLAVESSIRTYNMVRPHMSLPCPAMALQKMTLF